MGEKKGFFSKLKEGLSKTRDSIKSGIDSIFNGLSNIDDDFYEELEEIYNMCEEDDEVYINLIEDELPSLEVRISSTDFLIGFVPTNHIQLLACMRRGWKYNGNISSISGDIYEPIIWVKVIGNK